MIMNIKILNTFDMFPQTNFVVDPSLLYYLRNIVVEKHIYKAMYNSQDVLTVLVTQKEHTFKVIMFTQT